MRRFNLLFFYFLFFWVFYVQASNDLEVKDCLSDVHHQCKVKLRKIKQHDPTSYDIELLSSCSDLNVFSGVESKTTMEDISLYKINETYVFSKEYQGDSKGMDFVTFNFTDEKPSNIKYYNLESSINYKMRKKEWSGVKCSLQEKPLPPYVKHSLLASLSSICGNKINLPYNNTYSGNDIVFDIEKNVDGGVKENMTLVALDSNDSNNIRVNDLGCKRNCDPIVISSNFLGRINGDSRIKLHLKLNEGSVEGYYYYDKIQEKIKLSGTKVKNKIDLVASVNDGQETFRGVINDGQINGEWKSSEGRRYPFVLFQMLIQ